MSEQHRRLVIVAGGGSGIGKAVAKRFVDSGDDVTIIGRSGTTLDATAAELGPRVRPIVADLATASGANAVLSEIGNRTVDVIVLSAGSSTGQTPQELDEVEREWLRDFRQNTLTAVLLEHALRPFIAKPGGRVIGIGSIAGQIGSGVGGSYGAAKAALQAWVFYIARELGPLGVTANLVLPGYIPDTDFFGDRIDDEFHKVRVERSMLGRAGSPEEVAAIVEFLASDQASYITAQLIGVSGGTVLGR
jgi:3-oxoacyl-[acyl-carrier protein] reductase